MQRNSAAPVKKKLLLRCTIFVRITTQKSALRSTPNPEGLATVGLFSALKKYGIIQSMNSAGGRCHDNARCESMWARMKEELFYSREDKSENYTMKELKTMIWRYYMSYWANRRICTANGGLPPATRRKLYYDHIFLVA